MRSSNKWLNIMSVAIMLFFSSAAYADIINVNDVIRYYDREGDAGGGEFGIAALPNLDVELFRTFCIQMTESNDFTSNYKIDGISKYAELGHDMLDPQTAYLYTKFWNRSLTDYDYTPNSVGRNNSANSLQWAIWYFEGETLGAPPTFDSQALAWIEEANKAVASGLWEGLGDVRALNIVGMDGSPAQDQLVFVPEPGTLLLLGVGLLSLALGARKRRKTV